ncbi:MAG TPA: PorV/PorQ family protein [bacterium]|nr:PorV/PorQ family protein [bacterium]
MKKQPTVDSSQLTGRTFNQSRKIVLITGSMAIFWGLVGAAISWAQTPSGLAGLSMPLDNAQASARSAAFASAFVAVADDGAALFSNPAGLGNLNGGELSFHHQIWMADTNLDTLLITVPLPKLGGLGLAANYVNYGTFEGRDALGTPESPFSANRLALNGGWGFAWTEDFASGLGLKVSQQNLAGNSYTAVTAEGGLLWRALPEFNVGLAFDGLGGSGLQGYLPLAIRLGAAFLPRLSPDWRLTASASGELESGGVSRLQAGMEAVFQGAYALRAGYQMDLANNQMGGLTGLTLGAGYRLESLSLDYAFLPMGDFGTSHRLSLSYRFQVEGMKPHGEEKRPIRAEESMPVYSGAALPAPQVGGAVKNGPAANPPNLLVFPNPQPANTGLPGAGITPPGVSAASPPSAIGVGAPGFLQPTPLPSAPNRGRNGSSLSMSVSEDSTANSDAEEGTGLEFSLGPDDFQRAKTLEQKGQYVQAVHYYNQSLKKNPQRAEAWWGLGNCYVKLGKKEYAVRCLERYLSLKPDTPGLRDWLDRYQNGPTSLGGSNP